MPDVLLQTRVPEAIAQAVTNAANVEGDSIAGWLRRKLMRDFSGARIRALLAHERRCDPAVVLTQDFRPPFLLRPLREISATERVFGLLYSDGAPVSRDQFYQTEAFRQPDTQRFVLEGSPYPWRIVTAAIDAVSCKVELTLRVEGPGDGFVFEDWCRRTSERGNLSSCSGDTVRMGSSPSLEPLKRRCLTCGRPMTIQPTTSAP